MIHLKDLTNLKRLVLSNAQVTDDGLTHLKGLTNLLDLYLGGNAVTDARVAELRSGLPKLRNW